MKLAGGLALDASGNVYIADEGNNRIRRVDVSSGVITTFAGNGEAGNTGDGGPATLATLSGPKSIGLDASGNFYIADTGNNRIRRVAFATGIITTVAGGSEAGFDGDGGPATAGRLKSPAGLALDASDNLYIADRSNNRVRRVAAGTGIISTVAGNGASGFAGDGGPATAASFRYIRGVAVGPSGDVFIVDDDNGRIRRLAAGTGIITTVAGNGSSDFARDGGPATAAYLRTPNGVALDSSGDLYIAESCRIRRVAAGTGTITTVAGNGQRGPSGDGGPAVDARLCPTAVAFDGHGNMYASDGTRIRRVDAASGIITTVAGSGDDEYSFSGDGGPATLAGIGQAWSVAADSGGNIYICGWHRVRRVDGGTGIITTIAGDGGGMFKGDGGPATMASVTPAGVAIDERGNLYMVDKGADRIRRIEAATGIITTVAGNGTWDTSGDSGPATAAGLKYPEAVALDASSNLFIVDGGHRTIRRVAAGTGIITTVAGTGANGLQGDGGPAALASLTFPTDVVSNAAGDLFIADSGIGRVRAIFACRDAIGPFSATHPSDGALISNSAVNINWAKSDAAFRYDVVLDTEFPPKKVVQGDVTGQGFQLSGLEPGKTYYWQVRAKGDPYCPPVERTSGVRRFTVPMPCLPPAAPALTNPENPGTNTTLTFDGVPGASSYDVYLGTGVTLPAVASGLTGSTYAASGLQPGTTYRWRVAAHASCNTELTTSSLEGTFTVSGGCGAPQSAVLSSPAGGTTGLGQETTLLWQPVTGAGSYDVYLGTGSEPSLLATEVTGTSLEVSLQPGKTYRWKVVARSACDGTKTSSSNVSSFTTATACATPAVPSGLSSTKTTAYLGSSYTLTWEAVEGASSYTVERSKSGDFSSAEVMTAGQPSVVLTAAEKTTYFHRVRAMTSCGTESGRSPVLQTSVSLAPPHIEMLGPPRATVVTQQAAGVPLPRLEILVQNTGTSDFVGFFNTAQTIPFFIPSETYISLRAGEIRIFYLQLSGVPTDRAGVYEGILALQSSDPTDTTAYPQAYISLNITGQKSTDPIPTTTAPQILDEKGQPIEMLRFPAPIAQNAVSEATVRIKNTGSTPLDLGADFLPDPWVSIESADSSSTAWNATPIPVGASRDVKLKVQRIRGESGGASPRYTYLTLRTIDGKSSRLLLQDSETTPAGPCAGRPVLTPEESSLIVPSVVNARGKNNELYVSKVLITNLGPDAAQVELFYTPDTGEPATSGYDCAKVLQATLIAPGLDVISISDVLGQVFQTTGSGSLEIRSSRIGQLRVQSVVDAPAPSGGSFGFQLPVVASGEGARAGKPYSVIGVVQNGTYRTNVILTETSGQPASVTVTLYDTTGKEIGWKERVLGPYGKTQVSLSELAGGRELTGGAVEIEANSGSAGSVIGVTTVIDNQTSDASSFVARPVKPETRSTSYTVLSVVYTTTFQSRLEIRNNDTKAVTYRITYRGNTGTVESEPRTLEPRQEDAWENVLRDLLKLPPGGYGPLTITSDSPALQVVSRVYAETTAGTYGDAIEGIPTDDPVTTGESNRILIVDGLEGTADGDRTRGARTNLIMTEIAGGPVTLELSLWEKSQRRIAPLARKTYSFEAHQQIQLNDVFAALYAGQKDRTNAMAMLRPLPGSTGRIVALATRIDNKTNDTKNLALRP
ncbi:MAG: hypothetical protein L6R30_16540 [Thermoanaerobaculia bacterium]|nr:hypothetical protein [Thermoanaerobaculia bacterium]